MTPAIQDKNFTCQSIVDKSSEFNAFWGNADASEISGTLTRIFKKLMPFPQIDENQPKPKAYVGIDLGERKWIAALLAPPQEAFNSKHAYRHSRKRLCGRRRGRRPHSSTSFAH